jgi:hypothetical protein
LWINSLISSDIHSLNEKNLLKIETIVVLPILRRIRLLRPF